MQYIDSFKYVTSSANSFVFTIDTFLGTGTPNFTLPLRVSYNYNMLVDWGDGSESTITAYNDSEITHNYLSGGTYQISIQGTCEAWRFNNSGDKLKLISVDQLGDIGLLALDGGFFGCSNMTSFAGDNPNWVINVTNFTNAWRGCSSLLSFPELDISGATNLQGAWFSCSSLPSFPGLDSSNVTNFINTWRGCSSLPSFPELNTSGATNFFAAWFGCSSLTSFPQLDTSNVTDFQFAWQNCGSLTSFPELDTSGATNLQGAWQDCSSLTEIENFGSWVIIGVTSMLNMLSGVTLNTTNYDSTLIGWNSQRSNWTNLASFEMDFGNSKYTLGGAAETARASIISNGATNLSDGGGV